MERKGNLSLKFKNFAKNSFLKKGSVKKSSRGFTFVELTVLLTIVSLVVVTVVTSKRNVVNLQQKQETLKKIKKIEKALKVYLNKPNPGNPQTLPCPADPTLAFNESGFGEQETSSTATSTSECTGSNLRRSGTDVYMGIPPIRELGLRLDDITDGWGNRIMYVVSSDVTQTGWNVGSATPVAPPPALTASIGVNKSLKDGDTSSKEEEVAYVLISYGKDGIGAYSKDYGNRKELGDSAKNTHYNWADGCTGSCGKDDFLAKRITKKGETEEDKKFDDIVRFLEVSELNGRIKP